jgi:hypothetical protein
MEIVENKNEKIARLVFAGGTGTVTGANFFFEIDGKKILVDCGLTQGVKLADDLNWDPKRKQINHKSNYRFVEEESNKRCCYENERSNNDSSFYLIKNRIKFSSKFIELRSF